MKTRGISGVTGKGGTRTGNLYANVALDSPRYIGGGSSKQPPTLPSRENFAATSVAVCQILPRANHMEEERVAREGQGCIPGFCRLYDDYYGRFRYLRVS